MSRFRLWGEAKTFSRDRSQRLCRVVTCGARDLATEDIYFTTVQAPCRAVMGGPQCLDATQPHWNIMRFAAFTVTAPPT